MLDKRDFLQKIRVKESGFVKYKGYSDLVETYCCSATSSYYVVFPAVGYAGYFQKSDVEVKKRDKNGSRYL